MRKFGVPPIKMRDTLSLKYEIPRSAALNKESITAVYLYGFGDACAEVNSSSSTISNNPWISC